MKYAKLLSLSLVAFTLFGCNKTSHSSQVINPVEASNTLEENASSEAAINNEDLTASSTNNSSPQKFVRNVKTPTLSTQKNSSPQIAQKVETPTPQTQNSSSQYGTLEELNAKLKKRNGRIIGSATCDDDGLENDVRVDYNGDGMPDECVSANLKIDHPTINESSFATVNSSLQSLAEGCEESKKTQGNIVKSICRKNGEIVKASESHAELGDGIGYWFSQNRVVAVQRFHTGETFIFYRNGELSSKFADNFKTGKTEKITNFNDKQIQEADTLISGYQSILQAFGIN